MNPQFYILSLKHSPDERGNAVWWRPAASGYTIDLTRAGVYSLAEVEADEGYYNNGETTAAWYKEAVDALVSHAVPWSAVNPRVIPIEKAKVLGFEKPAPERDEPVLYGRGELPPRDSRDEHDRTL